MGNLFLLWTMTYGMSPVKASMLFLADLEAFVLYYVMGVSVPSLLSTL